MVQLLHQIEYLIARPSLAECIMLYQLSQDVLA